MSAPEGSSSVLSASVEEEGEYFYTTGLHLPRRFWLALAKEYEDITLDIEQPSQLVERVLDLKEYLNSSPPVLGSMMGMFRAAGLRVRLPGEVLSSCAITRTVVIKTVDGIEVVIQEANISIGARFYEYEGRVVNPTRLRAYDWYPLPDNYCVKMAARILKASMEERFWREPPPSPS